MALRVRMDRLVREVPPSTSARPRLRTKFGHRVFEGQAAA